MINTTKSEPRVVPRRGKSSSPPAPASSQARRQAAAILEVLAGVRRPSEAAQVLGTSLARYYLLERRALVGLLRACEPLPRGPGLDLSRRITVLERENRRLQRECDRQQALVRAAERSLGLGMPAVKSVAKGKEEPAGGGGAKRRRSRRPTVRALKAARTLQGEEPEVGSDGVATNGSALSATQSG